ncbi:MAG: lipopolysaccharide transport periplasmic protein LptA [Alphaproteobacteria bacterium]|nr:MAG: lipopolysaccharide transport periplasmic protein LptA [Alphaproteobacteria bacterium]
MIRIILLACLSLNLGLTLPLHAAPMANGGPVDITSKQLDVNQSGKTATFSGNVKVQQGTFTLTAPKVVADYSGSGADIKTIQATGGVIITRVADGATEKAIGTTATYAPGARQLVLSGNVTLVRGPSQLSGDKLVYDMASGNARVTSSSGPVKARFVPGAK